MAQHVEPVVDVWYDSKDFPECFRVVGFDNREDSVRIQYFDGEIEELEYETWLALHPHEIPEPEDATAAYEMEREDVLELLNEIENEQDLESHMRYIEDEDGHWS